MHMKMGVELLFEPADVKEALLAWAKERTDSPEPANYQVAKVEAITDCDGNVSVRITWDEDGDYC